MNSFDLSQTLVDSCYKGKRKNCDKLFMEAKLELSSRGTPNKQSRTYCSIAPSSQIRKLDVALCRVLYLGIEDFHRE